MSICYYCLLVVVVVAAAVVVVVAIARFHLDVLSPPASQHKMTITIIAIATPRALEPVCMKT